MPSIRMTGAAAGCLFLSLASIAAAQPSRRNLSACQLFAELELYPSASWAINKPGLVTEYIRSSIKQIHDRGQYDRDPNIQEASFELFKATAFSKDLGERFFSGPDQALEQIRRDVRDAMTGMSRACNVSQPGRALTPAEVEAQTRRAQERAPAGSKCRTTVYGGGGTVTICD